LKEVTKRHGFDADLSDEAIFRLIYKTWNLIGVLAIHVDDTIGGGTPAFHAIMDSVAEVLKIGSKEQINFHYKGLRISTVFKTDTTSFSIVVDGDEYLDATIPMELPSLSDDSVHLPRLHTSYYRSVVGCIGYMASSFRPDLSLEASLLSRSFDQPTLTDARKANATLHWAKNNRYPSVFRRGVACLTVFADAAGPNESGTQGGRVYALTDAEGHGVAGWIFWESRKVKRVCRSTATAEILSLGDGYDGAMWLRQVWLELSGQLVDVRLVVDPYNLPVLSLSHVI
jgi:hypothetical protein